MEAFCIDRQDKVPLGKGVRNLVRRAAREAARVAGGEIKGELSVALMDDETITELNRRFLGHDYPTDVLAFPPGETRPGRSARVAGDIAISVETASRQAQEYGITLDQEIALLVAHGVLHLLGYDDAPGMEGEMRKKEAQVLSALGYGQRE
jgi:probable rRNA maturation factor